MNDNKTDYQHFKLDILNSEQNPLLSAIGLEAEFMLYLNDEKTTPEQVFGDPSKVFHNLMMHRVGTSYHIPTGGAVYFDSGAIEVVTPIIEIEKECAARAGRSLWEGIHFMRDELDVWDKENNKKTRLEGFSTHYNISFELPKNQDNTNLTVEKLAWLLVHILPIPVMLLVANKKSTGIGVRPRGNRIEITADFTPSPTLMIVAAAFITGIVRKVMTWDSFELDMLEKMKIPVIKGFKPVKHTSRKGWLAKFDCFPANPFTCKVDEKMWDTTVFDSKISLRFMAAQIHQLFYKPIAAISGAFTFRMMQSVFSGKAPSLLDLPDRPKEYEDVGRLCTWNNLFDENELSRSKYERVLVSSILKRPLTLNGVIYIPISMKGWTKVVFENEEDKSKILLNVDYLIEHLDTWEKS